MALALVEAFTKARDEVRGVRNSVITLRDASSAGAVDAFRFQRLATTLAASDAILAALEVVGGIQQYARDQVDDQTYDVGVRFTDVRTELGTLIAWIIANYPTSAGGFQETFTFNPDGTSLPRSIPAAQLTGFITAANVFVTAADAFIT